MTVIGALPLTPMIAARVTLAFAAGPLALWIVGAVGVALLVATAILYARTARVVGRGRSAVLTALRLASFALLLLLMEVFHLEKIGYFLFPFLIREARKVSIDLMESLQKYMVTGQSRPFSIPPSLTAH